MFKPVGPTFQLLAHVLQPWLHASGAGFASRSVAGARSTKPKAARAAGDSFAERGGAMSPVVLIAHSLGWPSASRLSIACKNAGFSVAAIAPRNHPLHTMRSPDRTFVYSPYNTRGSLRSAIERSRPKLIIPCDERVVRHLHALHSACARDGDPLAKLIETSLGRPESYEPLTRRSLLIELASLPGVRVPPMRAIGDLGVLKAWIATQGLPVVLKLDGRSSGHDVMRIAAPADIGRVYASMKLRQNGLRALWDAVMLQDVEQMLSELRDGCRSAMTAQSYVDGRPANCAVACWRGEILGFVAVEAVCTSWAFGPASVVRRVEGREMRAAAELIVRHLGISGMCGFDFMIDNCSGEAMLIEINPRAT